MQIDRYLRGAIKDWLKTRMVFVGGPRQVGKTSLAKTFLTEPSGYLTWEDLADRSRLLCHELPASPRVLVLDEIHKYPRR